MAWLSKHGVNLGQTGDLQLDAELAEKRRRDTPKQKTKKKAPRQETPYEKDEILDVHGEDVESALFQVDGLIERAKKSGFKTVMVIHGIGQSAKEENNLRLAIRRHLETKAKGTIRSWRYQNPSEGAVIIKL